MNLVGGINICQNFAFFSQQHYNNKGLCVWLKKSWHGIIKLS
jgi:hypothetical protein